MISTGAISRMATSLKEEINPNAINLSRLNQLLDNASVQIDNTADRLVKVNIYVDLVKINTIAESIIEYVKSNKNSLGESECRSGLLCLQKMREFYKLSDDAIADSSCLTRICNVIRSFFEFIVSPFASSRGSIEVKSNQDYTVGPYNIESALKERLFRLTQSQEGLIQSQEGMAAAISSNVLSPPDQLRSFGRLLSLPETSDNEIRARFDRLPRTYQNRIKHQMWVRAGGFRDPLFNATQIDWGEDQIRSNPLPRELLSNAVQFFLNTAPVNTPGRNPFFTELDYLEALRVFLNTAPVNTPGRNPFFTELDYLEALREEEDAVDAFFEREEVRES
jgi:hypothetical protein